MSNWIDNKLEENQAISSQVIPLLDGLKQKYPDEKNTIDPLINELKSGFFDKDFLLQIRNKLRRMTTKDEYNLIKKRDEINKITRKIKTVETGFSEPVFLDFNESLSENFSFINGGNFYYLKFPKLNVHVDENVKSEVMLDRYIRDCLSNSIRSHKNGHEKLKCFSTFTIIFLHYFRPENAENFDTDNIGIKKPIDGINGILIENDTANRSDIFQIIVPSEDEFTEMYVIEGHALSKSILNLLKGRK